MAKNWKKVVGVVLLGYSGLPYLAVLILPFLGFTLAESGGFAVAFFATGEMAFVAAVALLGKEFIVGVKASVSKLVRRGYVSRPISRTRHHWGIALLIISFVPYYVVLIGEVLSFRISSAFITWTFISGEVVFLMAILILGNDFWARLKSLFAYSPESPMKESTP